MPGNDVNLFGAWYDALHAAAQEFDAMLFSFSMLEKHTLSKWQLHHKDYIELSKTLVLQ